MIESSTFEQRHRQYMEEKKAKAEAQKEAEQKPKEGVDMLDELFSGMTREEAEGILSEYQQFQTAEGLKKFVAERKQKQAEQAVPDQESLMAQYKADLQKTYSQMEVIQLKNVYRKKGLEIY